MNPQSCMDWVSIVNSRLGISVNKILIVCSHIYSSILDLQKERGSIHFFLLDSCWEISTVFGK